MGFPGGSDRKESACKGVRLGFDPWVGKIPWRKEWQHTPVFLPRESHGQRRLEDYSPEGHKELGTTEQLILSLSLWLLHGAQAGGGLSEVSRPGSRWGLLGWRGVGALERAMKAAVRRTK